MQTNNLQKMQLEITQAPDGSCAYVDITLPGYVARATVGRLGTEQGYCDTEILDSETAAMLHWQHQEFTNSAELNAVLTEFFGALRELPSASIPTSAFALPLSDKSVSLNSLMEPLFAATVEH